MKGKRLKELREQRGISQTDLALKIGESKQTLYKYENDLITNVPSDKIELMAEELGCSPAYLMGWIDSLYPVPDDTEKSKAIRELYANIPSEVLEDPTTAKQIMELVNLALQVKPEARIGLLQTLKSLLS